MKYEVKCPVCGKIFPALKTVDVPRHDMKEVPGFECQWYDTTGEVLSAKP